MMTGRGFISALARRLRSTRPHWKRKNSSKISRRCAGERNALSSSRLGLLGRKMRVTKRGAPIDEADAASRRSAGSGSGSTSGNWASAWCTRTRCILVVTVPVFS